MITTEHFLDRPYRIPNIEETKDLQAFIDYHEAKLLRAIFGTTLYNLFVAGIGAPTPEQKWVDLRDGKVYSYNSTDYEFLGLIELLKSYIYAKWLKENEDKVTNSGVMRNTVDKSEHVGGWERYVSAYNVFSSMAGNIDRQENTFYGFMYANWEGYVTNLSDWIFCYPHNDPEFENQLGI